MRCFYCDTIDKIGESITLPSQDEKHLFRTLRASVGEQVELLNGKGGFAIAEVIENKQLEIRSLDKFDEPEQKIHLFVAPPKKQKMDQLLRQVTELGVWSITPIITERSVSIPEKVSTLDRWKTIMIEACKQAKNPFLPEISLPVSFDEGIQKTIESKMESYFGSVHDVKSAKVINISDKAWFIGPEGGFTESEEKLMLQSSFTPVKIGKWVLRVETAAVAGLVYLM